MGLSLSRYRAESVEINVPGWSPITVTIDDVRGGGLVRLTFQAQPEIAIDRSEVADQKRKEGRL